MQSPDSSVGSSSYDLMMAAPAIANGGGASSTAAGAMGLRTGYIPVTEEYKALQEWATQYRDEITRGQSIAKKQMQHLIGKHNESTQEASGFRTANIAMMNELNLAKVMLQSERPTTQQILQEYTSSCQSLELSKGQLAHLAQRANEAAIAYGHKDEELKINALQHERTIRRMNEQATLDKDELRNKLQVSYQQCKHVVATAGKNQSQAQADIELILEENQYDKEKMRHEMQQFVDKGGDGVQQLRFCEDQYAHLQTAFTRLQEAETEGRKSNVVLEEHLEWTQAQFEYGEEQVAKLWHGNQLGHEVLSSLRMEYENQCNHYAQEVRVVSEANSSQTLKTFEGRIEGLAAELMQEKLKSKFQDEEIQDMQFELEDRDGQLLEMQK